MRPLFSWFVLPSSLVRLILVSATTTFTSGDPIWPTQLPLGVKYYPEDVSSLARASAVQAVLATKSPIGVRKMPSNEGDMFFLEYWQFDPEGEEEIARRLGATHEEETHDIERRATPSFPAWSFNTSSSLEDSLVPSLPFLPHAQVPFYSNSPRNIFARQSFTCPSGTNNCASVGNSNVCCPSGQSCVPVPDTGLGTVGCCPTGQTCTNAVSNCNTGAGYSSCPGSSNGGCCIPGYTCQGIGCISTYTSTTTTTLPTKTVGGGGGAATTCPSGAISCAASLGGGCCQSNQLCWTGTTCLTRSSISPIISTSYSTTTTTLPVVVSTAEAPIRPIPSSTTSSSTILVDTTTTVVASPAVPPGYVTTGTSVITVCPTNYYLCSAYYIPGCCSIGRDCAVRDCPAAASSSVVASGVATVLVPAGSTTGGTTVVSTSLTTATIRGQAAVPTDSGSLGTYSCLLVSVVILALQ